MWRAKLIQWVYVLNTHVILPDTIFSRILKKAIRRLVFMGVQGNEKMLIKVHEMPFYIRPTPSSIQEYILQPFEPYTTELFLRALKPGAVVLDIGAQFGYYSLLAAKIVGPTGRVFAFEPVPSNFEILKKNIEINNFTSIIRPIRKAAGDKRGIVSIYLYKHSDSHGMFRHPKATVKETLSIECITIDEFLEENAINAVNIIKMDIEGYEPYALEGMKQIIFKSSNLILFTELVPGFLRLAGVKPEDYLKQLEKLGFDVQLIDEHSHCLKPVTEDFLTKGDAFRHANLYCTKIK